MNHCRSPEFTHTETNEIIRLTMTFDMKSIFKKVRHCDLVLFEVIWSSLEHALLKFERYVSCDRVESGIQSCSREPDMSLFKKKAILFYFPGISSFVQALLKVERSQL